MQKGVSRMANEQNLIPGGYKLSVEEQSRGGKRSAEARKRRKKLKQVLEELLAGELSRELAMALNEKSEALGIDTSGFTVADYMGLAQVVKAVGGDSTAFTLIRDTVGEKPVDKQEMDIKAIPKINVVRKDG